MIRKTRNKIILTTLMLAFVLALSSCGKKGPLIPPSATIDPPLLTAFVIESSA